MNYEANIQKFRIDRKGNIYFIFFMSSEALLNNIQSDCKAMTFCRTCRKNFARIECATHHERLYSACIWSKTTQLCKEFPENAKDLPGSFPEAVVQRVSLKEMFLRISQNSKGIPCTGVSS